MNAFVVRRDSWRASPHCTVVNLVRAGRQQPQPFVASAGGKARHPFPTLAEATTGRAQAGGAVAGLSAFCRKVRV